MYRVSVVVPTYQRPAHLARCLEALRAQELDPTAYEVIVVDDAASAATRRQVGYWADPSASALHPAGSASLASASEVGPVRDSSVARLRPGSERLQSCSDAPGSERLQSRGAAPGTAGFQPIPGVGHQGRAGRPRSQVRRAQECVSVAPTVRYLAVTGRHGPAAARNAGWRAAHGAIIAFTDDDCIPAPGWLRAGLAACVDGVAGVAGRVVVPTPPCPTDYERNAAQLEEGKFVTANCFYRRDVLEAVGGFDERFTVAWREDSDLFFTLLERRASLAAASDAVVAHPIRVARWGISVRQQRKSLYNALLYKKHPALYRRHIQPTPPWPYYGIVGALLAAIAARVVGGRASALAGAGASAWLLLTARFCLRRLRHTSHAPRHVAEMALTSAVIPPLALYWRLRGALAFRVFFL